MLFPFFLCPKMLRSNRGLVSQTFNLVEVKNFSRVRIPSAVHICRVGAEVSTSPFQGEEMGALPIRDTNSVHSSIGRKAGSRPVKMSSILICTSKFSLPILKHSSPDYV